MIRLCNPKLCLYKKCNIQTNKFFCKNHFNAVIDYIPYFINIDPFIIESRIICFQYYWRNKLIIKKNRCLIKNMDFLVNKNDPITQELIFRNNYLLFDINHIYPLIINNKMYIYKLESLLQIINYDNIEIFTQTKIKNIDIQNIKYLCKKLNIDIQNDILTDIEINHLKITDTLQKFDILGTYFPIKLYNNINNIKKKLIYNELKLIWNAFCQDNNISDIDLYKKKINWDIMINNNNIEIILIDKINFLLNNNLDYNLRKMITYLIIGAFAYVDVDIKKIYTDIDFI